MVCLLVAALLATIPLAPALAAGGTCSDNHTTNRKVGYKTSAETSINGAMARIQFQNPDLCGSDTDDGSASVAWSMVQADSATYPNDSAATGYAQAGYGQFAHSNININTFTQWTLKCKATKSCSGFPAETRYDPTGTNPADWTYRVREQADGKIWMEAGQGITDTTTYDPSGDWEASWRASFFGETLDRQSDVVGISSDRTLFDNLKKYNDNGNWANLTSFISQNEYVTRYNLSSIGGNATDGYYFTIWTYPL